MSTGLIPLIFGLKIYLSKMKYKVSIIIIDRITNKKFRNVFINLFILF